MSATLSINNYGPTNTVELGNLNADATSGDTTVSLINIQNIGADDFIAIGAPSEGAEIVQVDSVNGNIATLKTALKLNHYRNDVVRRLFGDKIMIYRASNTDNNQPSDNTFSAVTNGTIDIDPDQAQTFFTDIDGSSDYWYKAIFYNSNTTITTDLSQSQAARGNGYGDYCSVFDIKNDAGFEHNRYITDMVVDRHRQAAQAIINAKLAARYNVPFAAPINAYITDLTIRLASAYLKKEQFGMTAEVRDQLTAIEAEFKELQQGSSSLVGVTPIEQSNVSGGLNGMDGWPNNTTATTDGYAGGGERLFRISDVQGFGSRRY